MGFFEKAISIKQIQWLTWLAVALFLFVTLTAADDIYHALTFTLIYISFYALIIYGNIFFLYPRFYETGHKIKYALLSCVFIIVVSLVRALLMEWISNHFSLHGIELKAAYVKNFIAGSIFLFLLSFIFRFALAYFAVKQQSEKLQAQHSQAQLNLLKSQVQPHFLFNTLNNIYYEAYREAPRTALLIEKLSDVMRYFVDETPKEKVLLAMEVKFLENYMALEKIRLRHDIDLDFIQEYDSLTLIPPMLLITFVENIFKHGIDKSVPDNKVFISLIQKDGYLIFKTENRIFAPVGQTLKMGGGFGLNNLKQRIGLLYGTRADLNIRSDDHVFTAFLKIPVV
jgi:sensor histidine kinase YesM